MVAKLNFPEYDSEDIVKQVIAQRVHHKDFFESFKDDWLAVVVRYIEKNGNPSSLAPFDFSHHISQIRIDAEMAKIPKDGESVEPLERLVTKRKNSLIGLYEPNIENELYVILDNMRRKHGLSFCPSCGEPGKPGTLDHYLPKSVYPELSIVLVNLTPMCSECQGEKGKDIKDGNGNKLYIHPYFDLEDEVTLSLEITEPYKHPSTFTVSVPDSVSEPLKSLVERHMAGIDFYNRFGDFCINEYTDLLSTIAEEREEKNPDTAHRIVKRFLRKAERQSPNRWEAIFYRGILSNIELLNYLDEGELPEFL